MDDDCGEGGSGEGEEKGRTGQRRRRRDKSMSCVALLPIGVSSQLVLLSKAKG